MVMKGQVAKLSGFQEEVGTEMVGILMVGLTMFTGGMMSATSNWLNAETRRGENIEISCCKISVR